MDEITRNNFDYIESRVATTNASFIPKVWQDGDILTSAEFNRIEQGIANSNILDNIDLKTYIYNILKLKGVTLDVGYTLNDMVKAVSMLGRYEYRPLPINEENPDIRINQPNGSIRLLYKDIAPCKSSIWIKTKDTSQFTVDWGDGLIEKFNSESIANHDFVKGSGANVNPSFTVFVVTITGNLSEFRTNNFSEGLIWFCGKNIDLDSLIDMFKGNQPSLSRIEFIGTDTLKSKYDTTNRFHTFENCSAFKELIGIRNINLSSSTNTQNMFYSCSSLTTLPPILDLSSCTNTAGMFNGCNSLTTLPTILDLSSCTNTAYMFNSCNSLTTLPTILDLSSCTNTAYMFNSCRSLTTLPTILDLSSCTNTDGMFQNCSSLTTLPTILDLSSCTNTAYMFNGCNSLTTLPTILDLSSCTNTDGMFNGCSSDKLKRICCINVKANQWNNLANSVPKAKVGKGNVFVQNNIIESARTILTNKNWTVENYVPQPK